MPEQYVVDVPGAGKRHQSRLAEYQRGAAKRLERKGLPRGLGAPVDQSPPGRRSNETEGQAGPRRCGKARCP